MRSKMEGRKVDKKVASEMACSELRDWSPMRGIIDDNVKNDVPAKARASFFQMAPKPIS